MRVALVAQHDEAELHSDGPRLLAAFDELGVEAEIVPWGRPTDWSGYSGVVVRGASDYLDRQDEFFGWAEEVASVTRLANPVSVLRWNADKRYLRDLGAAGVPVVPTVWVEPGEVLDPAAVAWGELVVKPTASAGARWTGRYGRSQLDAAVEHVGRIHSLGAGAGAMIQPYLRTVDVEGETGVYVFGGTISHAVSKRGVLELGAAPVGDFSLAIDQEAGPTEVTPALGAFAEQVLDAMPAGLEPLLYARVDSVADGVGGRLLLELELIEPFLFLDTCEPAAARFAAAVADWLRT